MSAPVPRYDPSRWDELEKLAAVRLAEAGTTLPAVEASIASMRGGRTDEELHKSAVLAAIDVGGPPPSEEGLRKLAAVLGLVLAAKPAPATPGSGTP